jgi:hypothetical protein
MNRFILKLALLATPLMAWAQEEPMPARSVFKVSPLHFFQNTMKVGLERFNKDHSGSFLIAIGGKMGRDEGSSNVSSYQGFSGELQLRKYVKPMQRNNTDAYYHGVFGALYAQGGSFSGEATKDGYRTKEHIGNYGGGFMIGYQKTLWDVIFLEGYVGGGVQFADRVVKERDPASTSVFDVEYSGVLHPAFQGIMPKIGFTIGLAL